jgi:hypothetical protein
MGVSSHWMERTPLETIDDPAGVVRDDAADAKVIVDVEPHDHGETLLDEALEETFPASDPIAPAIKAR